MKPFIGRLTGDISAECDASDLGLDLSSGNQSDWFDTSSDVDIYDVSVSGTVTLEARAVIDDFEIEVTDYDAFDADTALQERINPYGGVDASGAEFEPTGGPEGFDEVAAEVGPDVALRVYVILSNNGLDVV